MKKILFVCLSLMLAAGFMAGCGGQKAANDAPKKICANENPNSGISYKKDVLLSGSPLP